MSLNKLASAVAKREGKKSQARIGDIREILSILSDMMFEQFERHGWKIDMDLPHAIDSQLYRNGQRRAKKIKK